MGFFRDTNRTGPYFEGWYFKHQNPQGQTLALIPAFHIDRDGHRTASLQVISKDQAWWLEYPEAQLQVSRQPFQVQIGQSSFGSQGIDLHIQQDNLSLCGSLRYGPFTALRSDIMGPFRFFAGMQCSHGVISMGHSLSGTLELNGERLDFSDGIGYIETDRGRSFPNRYLWTLDTMCLGRPRARQSDACNCDDPPACGQLHWLHLLRFVPWPGIPPGHLSGRQNRGVVLHWRGDPSGTVSPGGRTAERAAAGPPGSSRGPHGAHHPRESLRRGSLPLLARRPSPVSAHRFQRQL